MQLGEWSGTVSGLGIHDVHDRVACAHVHDGVACVHVRVYGYRCPIAWQATAMNPCRTWPSVRVTARKKKTTIAADPSMLALQHYAAEWRGTEPGLLVLLPVAGELFLLLDLFGGPLSGGISTLQFSARPLAP